jgi:hypothetical protein
MKNAMLYHQQCVSFDHGLAFQCSIFQVVKSYYIVLKTPNLQE